MPTQKAGVRMGATQTGLRVSFPSDDRVAAQIDARGRNRTRLTRIWRVNMRVHVKRNRLMQTVDIYVIESRGFWLQLEGHDTIRRVEVAEGTEGPVFLSLSDTIWEAIVGQVPDAEESFVKQTLAREQTRVDKLIDHVLSL
jgi:hypothetical protein